jgi:phosphatidylserine/phosphatidylglycerophosphate/cardiolipin synthase-like enzyme
MATEFIKNRELYEGVIRELIPLTREYLWIATSDLKDMYVHHHTTGNMVPFLSVLSELIDRNVAVRMIHAKEPGEAFREDFDRYPNLIEGLERMLCPRMHFKCVVADGIRAYIGSANITGAGLGAKSDRRRNIEAGVLSDDPNLVEPVVELFDTVWMGSYCTDCGRKEFCADYRDIVDE